jgi:serine/threonine protein kinase
MVKERIGLTVNLIYLVEKQSTKELFILKMIDIGKEGTEEGIKARKDAGNEFGVGMMICQSCPFIVQYFEMFYHENFSCFIIEYCEGGDIQKQINKGKVFDESVYFSFNLPLMFSTVYYMRQL